jgi:hypothetical protein
VSSIDYEQVSIPNPVWPEYPALSHDRYAHFGEFGMANLFVHQDTGIVVADIARFESWLEDVVVRW